MKTLIMIIAGVLMSVNANGMTAPDGETAQQGEPIELKKETNEDNRKRIPENRHSNIYAYYLNGIISIDAVIDPDMECALIVCTPTWSETYYVTCEDMRCGVEIGEQQQVSLILMIPGKGIYKGEL